MFRLHKLRQIDDNTFSMRLESDRISKAYLGYGLSTIWEWFGHEVTRSIYASKRRSKWIFKYIDDEDHNDVEDLVV